MKYFWIIITTFMKIVDFFFDMFGNGDFTKSPFWGYKICEKCKRPYKDGFAGLCVKCFKSMKIDEQVEHTQIFYDKIFGGDFSEYFVDEVIRRSGKDGEDYLRRKEYEKKQYIRQQKLDRICKN